LELKDFKIEKFNNFWIGFVPGIFIPPLFIWLYMNQFSPFDTGFIDTIKVLYPSALLGKLLLLSAFPNLALLFVFYKTDSFKLGAGILSGGMPYLISSFFML
jgi:hypothetical protein